MLINMKDPGNTAGQEVENAELGKSQAAALASAAETYNKIAKFHDCYSIREEATLMDNVNCAREFAGHAMVNLAIVAGQDDEERVRNILNGYGLLHLL